MTVNVADTVMDAVPLLLPVLVCVRVRVNVLLEEAVDDVVLEPDAVDDSDELADPDALWVLLGVIVYVLVDDADEVAVRVCEAVYEADDELLALALGDDEGE